MPRRRFGAWHLTRLWVVGVLVGGGLLAWNTITEHQGHNESWVDEDRKLLNRYAGQLLEVHSEFSRLAAEGNPKRFLTGYLSAGEIEDDLRMAYRAAAEAEWLDGDGWADYNLAMHYLGDDEPPESLLKLSETSTVYAMIASKAVAGEPLIGEEWHWVLEFDAEPDSGWFGDYLLLLSEGGRETDPTSSPKWHQRYLWVGGSYYAVWLLTLLFAPAALIGLFRGPSIQAWRVTQTWIPAIGLALTFWALLAGNGLATFASVIVNSVYPKAWEGPSYHLFSNLFYLMVQAGPVILVSWFLLPTGRSFRRVFGLGPAHLFNARNLAIVLGFYGLYGFLSFGFYEFEKWVGTTDTRDFLDPGLIDSGQLGLISQIVLAAVIAPVFEEFLFRGFLFTSLKSRTNVWVAALISSLIFAGMHFYSWPALISILVFGMAMCWLYQRTGSLWPGILFHALMNFHITVSSWFLYSEDFSWQGYLDW